MNRHYHPSCTQLVSCPLELTPLRCLFAVWMLLIFTPKLHAQGQALSLPGPFHFEGTSYVTLGNSAALAPTSQITITAWVKSDFSNQNVQDTILEKRDGCGYNRSYELAIVKTFQNYTPGTIFFAASNAGTDDLFSTVPVPNDGQYHHVAGTYDGAYFKLFLDGALVGQGTHTGPISNTSDPAVIGVNAGCGDLSYADIGPIKIYDHAVPDNQIMSEAAGLALLTGGNNFSGNQIVNGTVSATALSGDGFAITDLNPANLASGTAGINITGTAASALTASNAASANTANNALSLGGVSAGNYARLDVGNTFIGNQTISNGDISTSGSVSAASGTFSGPVSVGSGTPITKHSSTQFTNVAFNLKLSPNTCTNWSGKFSAAADGDTVAVGMGSSLMSANIVYSAWATSGGVIVRICNPTGSPTNVGSGNIRIDVWKH